MWRPYRLSGTGNGLQHAREGLLTVVQGFHHIAALERPSRQRIADMDLCRQGRGERRLGGVLRRRRPPRQLRPTNAIDTEERIERDTGVGNEAADCDPAECAAGIGLGEERV